VLKSVVEYDHLRPLRLRQGQEATHAPPTVAIDGHGDGWVFALDLAGLVADLSRRARGAGQNVALRFPSVPPAEHRHTIARREQADEIFHERRLSRPPGREIADADDGYRVGLRGKDPQTKAEVTQAHAQPVAQR
jgi:hypothetical protein